MTKGNSSKLKAIVIITCFLLISTSFTLIVTADKPNQRSSHKQFNNISKNYQTRFSKSIDFKELNHDSSVGFINNYQQNIYSLRSPYGTVLQSEFSNGPNSEFYTQQIQNLYHLDKDHVLANRGMPNDYQFAPEFELDRDFTTGSPQLGESQNSYSFAPGEFIVKFKSDIKVHTYSDDGISRTDLGSIDKLNLQYDVLHMQPIFSRSQRLNQALNSNIYKLNVPLDSDILSIVEAYSDDPNVEYAEPNGLYQVSVFPNDPEFERLWGLHNTGQTGGTINADIDAPQAWDIHTGSSDVIIAIIDTGVDYNHEDLAGNIWINLGEDVNSNGVVDEDDFNGVDDDENGFVDDIRGWDFIYDDNNPNDVYGHGTHCSGTAAALSNNGIGITGVSWDCQIMVVKGLGDNGWGLWTDIADAIIYATDMGADVISMSLGGGHSQVIEEAVEYAYNKDVVIVAAAMNRNSQNKGYPAAYDEVIAVAATDHNDRKASFSNYGDWITVSAPGVRIYSTFPDNEYTSWQGTSMATPHVSGLAALIRSIVPHFSNSEVIQRIVDTADPIDDKNPGYEGLLGSGRINAFEAVSIYEHNVGVKSIQIDPIHIQSPELISVDSIVYNNGMNNEHDIVVRLLVDGVEVDSRTIPLFERSSKKFVNFTWLPSTAGTYSITVNISILGGVENFFGDNDKTDLLFIGVRNLNTNKCNSTIQNTLDDPDTLGGHTLLVPEGIYYENIILNKSVSIQGIDRTSTVICDGGSRDSTIEMDEVSSVTISKLTVRDGTNGISIFSSTDISVEQVDIIENLNAGITLSSSSNVNIANMNFSSNNIGIFLTNYSSLNKIYDNNIFDNQLGINIDETSTSNSLYYNMFDNTENAYDLSPNNYWDHGYHDGYFPGGGNWWSDYTGNDEYHGLFQDEPGSDLVGDTPYNIPGGNNKDMYPLMRPGHLPRIFYVDDNNWYGPWDGSKEHPFKDIQDAIDAASNDYTIFVRQGRYRGSIVIDRSIKLIGESGGARPTIVGYHESRIFFEIRITADDVEVRGFTLVNWNERDPLYERDSGILLAGVTNCKIVDNNLITGGILFTSEEYINGVLTLDEWNTHHIENNYANEKPIYYFKNINQSTIIPSDAGQVILANCSNFTIENLVFDNYVGMAIQLGFSSNNTIRNNEIMNQYWNGIILRDSPCNTITRNIITNKNMYEPYGIEIAHNSNKTIVGNNTLYHNLYGIVTRDSSNVVITHYQSYNNRIGIYQTGYSAGNIIKHCTIKYGGTGIGVSYASHVLIYKNTIVRNPGGGISLREVSEIEVFDNYLLNNAWDGIQSWRSSNVTIMNNSIELNPSRQGRDNGYYYTGIDVIYSYNHTILNNRLRSNGISIYAYPFDLIEAYTSHIIENNYANDKPIYYYKNRNDPHIIPSDAGQILIMNCSNMIIKDINIDDVDLAIHGFQSNNIIVSNATLTNSQIGIYLFGSDNIITNCIIDYNRYGLAIGGDRNRVEKCAVSNNEYTGIEICGNNNIVTKCNVRNMKNRPYYADIGIIVGSVPELDLGAEQNIISECTISNITGFGIYTLYSENTTISGNKIIENYGHGILTESSSNNVIFDNKIADTMKHEFWFMEATGIGICLWTSSSTNCITNNLFADNKYGVYIFESSQDNTIFHNNFLNNERTAFSTFDNIWDNGYPAGGNFWDDYRGMDNNGDGIGEDQYNISGGSNKDRYPLTNLVPCSYPIPPPRTVYVDDDYDSTISGWNYNRFVSIQEGILAITFHGHINVMQGTYNENVLIYKPLELHGELMNSTIIKSVRSNDDVLSVEQTNNIMITDFTIQNGRTGIRIQSSGNITIENCIIHDGRTGIQIQSSREITIENCIIFDNNRGISIFDESTNIHIVSNLFNNNSRKMNWEIAGDLEIDDFYYPINGGTIIKDSNNIKIAYNTFFENLCGVGLSSDSSSNKIYNNNFFNNTQQSYDLGYNNQWENRYPFGGNFWSDYNSSDNHSGRYQKKSGSDGIGDTCYPIHGGINVDRYPLMEPYTSETKKIYNVHSRKTFTTIQSAIDDSDTKNGDTLFIRTGVYHENLIIDKSLHLIGEDKKSTILFGVSSSEDQKGVHITAEKVKITGFTIQNFSGYALYIESRENTIYDNILIQNKGGILLYESNKNIIRDNIIADNERFGIWMVDSQDTLIYKNIIRNHYYDGIYVHSLDDGWSVGPGCDNTDIYGNILSDNWFGVSIGYGGTYPGWKVPPIQSDINIIGNTFDNNLAPLYFSEASNCNLSLNRIFGTGFEDSFAIWFSDYNHIYGNWFTNVHVAIRMIGGSEYRPCENNVISKNTIQNGNAGVYLGDYMTGGSNNLIYHNNFINNIDNAIDEGDNNIWDNNYPSGGNYWSDYGGLDQNEDGIGDTPYQIYGNYPISQDRFPWMAPFNHFFVYANGPYNGYINESVRFTGFTLGGNAPYQWHWDFGDGTTSDEQNPIHTYTTLDTFTITVTVVDSDGRVYTDTTTAIITEYYDDELPVKNIDKNSYYWTIQEAIDDVDPHNTIHVRKDNYYEQLEITKPLTLIGENKNNTIINGLGDGTTITITADQVTIQGFTIKNSDPYPEVKIRILSNHNTITDNIITSPGWTGIYLDHANYNIITRNTIHDIFGNGICLQYSSYNAISQNTLRDNSGDAIELKYSCNENIIEDNQVISNKNGADGIVLAGSYYGKSCNHNIIRSNTISDNAGRGISIWASHYNIIEENFISNNNQQGILLGSGAHYQKIINNTIKDHTSYPQYGLAVGIKIYYNSHQNTIYQNNLINNTNQAFDECTNTWYSESLQKGNYWNDYTGIDSDGNGIGDTPYEIPGGNNQDTYPLMNAL